MSIIEKKAAGTPATPPTGYVHWFVNASDVPSYVDAAGVVHDFTGTTGATGPTGPTGPPVSLSSPDGSLAVAGTGPVTAQVNVLPKAVFTDLSTAPDTPASGTGVHYVLNNVPYFCSDLGAVHELPLSLSLANGTVTVTGATSDLYGVEFTLPANTVVVGTQIKFELAGFITQSNATNFLTWLMIGGVKYASTSHSLSGTQTSRQWWMRGLVEFKAVGATGTFVAVNQYTGAPNASVAIAGTNIPTALARNGDTPTVIDTTANIPVKLGVNLSSATNTSASIALARVTLYTTT